MESYFSEGLSDRHLARHAASPRSPERSAPAIMLEQIGEGGMGVVFRAEQSSPVRRTAALKVIKPGMDSAQFIARLEAERQALALMDHPSIAKFLDAGTTEFDRPFLVMELVDGIPITEYCNRNRLALIRAPRALRACLIPNRTRRAQAETMGRQCLLVYTRSTPDAWQRFSVMSRWVLPSSVRRNTSTPSRCWSTGTSA